MTSSEKKKAGHGDLASKARRQELERTVLKEEGLPNFAAAMKQAQGKLQSLLGRASPIPYEMIADALHMKGERKKTLVLMGFPSAVLILRVLDKLEKEPTSVETFRRLLKHSIVEAGYHQKPQDWVKLINGLKPEEQKEKATARLIFDLQQHADSKDNDTILFVVEVGAAMDADIVLKFTTTYGGNATSRTCCLCGRKPTTLMRCKQCLTALYCDKECQSVHWKHHKQSCNPASSIASTIQATTSPLPAQTDS